MNNNNIIINTTICNMHKARNHNRIRGASSCEMDGTGRCGLATEKVSFTWHMKVSIEGESLVKRPIVTAKEMNVRLSH